MELDRTTHKNTLKMNLNAVKFTLNSTYFIFNKKIYKQTHGAPIGSPLSPIIADLALQNLESHTLKNLSFQPLFYIRYVDDIAMAVPRKSLNELLHNFNTFHPRLKFVGKWWHFFELFRNNHNQHRWETHL